MSRAPEVYDFEWFRVRQLAHYGWIFDRAPAVMVVPVAPDGRVWLVRIARTPTRTRSWEVPGGALERGEDVERAGLRELEEECGLVARGPVRVHPRPLEPVPGMGRFPHHVVCARGVVPRGARPVPQKEEGIVVVRRFDAGAVRRMFRSGAIGVQATIAALAVSGWLDEPTPPARRLGT